MTTPWQVLLISVRDIFQARFRLLHLSRIYFPPRVASVSTGIPEVIPRQISGICHGSPLTASFRGNKYQGLLGQDWGKYVLRPRLPPGSQIPQNVKVLGKRFGVGGEGWTHRWNDISAPKPKPALWIFNKAKLKEWREAPGNAFQKWSRALCGNKKRHSLYLMAYGWLLTQWKWKRHEPVFPFTWSESISTSHWCGERTREMLSRWCFSKSTRTSQAKRSICSAASTSYGYRVETRQRIPPGFFDHAYNQPFLKSQDWQWYLFTQSPKMAGEIMKGRMAYARKDRLLILNSINSIDLICFFFTFSVPIWKSIVQSFFAQNQSVCLSQSLLRYRSADSELF